ncbi:MAG: LarC family nickel insertion protein, partial [Pseudobutyrivibrio sp.]|nr:LarC family nickel insertion protein [Pseudobutyrivibrio sp.]
MGRTLYLECNSGISGDMTVGALLDLGADVQLLSEVLSTVRAEGFKVAYSRVKRAGLDCMDFDVILDDEHDGHDHDMDYLYGHLHSEEEHHHHGHQHDHEHHHAHRGMREINEIIDAAAMTDRARATAKRIFEIIGQAESKAHGVPVADVHFHEVGAVDSIVDVVAIAVCLDNLDITDIIVPKLYEGQGTVRCQHGILPVPVPAVTNIVTDSHIPLEIIDVAGELVTPTGAAVAAL